MPALAEDDRPSLTRTPRDEYLRRCKARALQYVDAGDLSNSVASMASDVRKDDATRFSNSIFSCLVAVAVLQASQGDAAGVRNWIAGFF